MRRKCIILLIVVISFSFLSANSQTDNCVTNDMNIYFGNGMNTIFTDAVLDAIALQIKLVGKVPEDLNIQYGLSYNQKEGPLDQLLEVARQNESDNFSQVLLWLVGIGIAPQWFQDWMTESATAFDDFEYVVDSDLQRHVQMYRTNLLEGKPVVLVSHSQGNFYANRASGLLQSESFAIVGAATPAGYVAGNGDYTSLTDDLVLLAVGIYDLTILPGNSTNSRSYEWTNHSFDQSYLRGDVSGPKLVSQIKSAVETIEYPDVEGQQGVITVTLEWGAEPDVDLHIFEPNGSHVYYGNMQGQSGYLDVDDVTSFGPEHYYVSCDNLETGTYIIGVNYFEGNNSEVAKIQVKAGNKVMNFNQTLSQADGGDSSPYIVANIDYSLNSDTGRYEFQIFSSSEPAASANLNHSSTKSYESDKVNIKRARNF